MRYAGHNFRFHILHDGRPFFRLVRCLLRQKVTQISRLHTRCHPTFAQCLQILTNVFHHLGAAYTELIGIHGFGIKKFQEQEMHKNKASFIFFFFIFFFIPCPIWTDKLLFFFFCKFVFLCHTHTNAWSMIWIEWRADAQHRFSFQMTINLIMRKKYRSVCNGHVRVRFHSLMNWIQMRMQSSSARIWASRRKKNVPRM